MPVLADNPRTATKATIKRESAKARAGMNRYDRDILDRLDALYQTARSDLTRIIRGYAGQDSTLRLEVLQSLLGQVNIRLDRLTQARDLLIDEGLSFAVQQGIAPFSGAVADNALSRVADEALRFSINQQMNDGLKLSDRLWRNSTQSKRLVGDAISQAIIQGNSASQAAQDFLSRGVAVPIDIQQGMNGANLSGVDRVTGDALMKSEANAYSQARRLFRTEINRAHIEAYRNAGFEHPDVIGTRFLLSNRHPKADICDMHAKVNLYGLGAGVYPPGKSPLPAHPNTLSYEVVVFADEVTADDIIGKETRIEWLKKQTVGEQVSVVGGRKKYEALEQGVLKENEIATPWRVLEKRYVRRGVVI